MARTRLRLDELVVLRGLAPSRSAARGLILAGLVNVAGEIKDKVGLQVPGDAEIVVAARPRFVSRGGDKLAHAMEHFGVAVEAAHALDVGASTGGFVDCLLQAGAERVIALDVGRGQLDFRLRTDERVYLLERTNARRLTPDLLPFDPDFVTMDVSFISVTKVLPAVVACMAPSFRGMVLIKPQFEVGRRFVGKGGVVRNTEVKRSILLERAAFVIEQLKVELLGLCRSGLLGADGNEEFFFFIARGGEKGMELDTLGSLVDGALFTPLPDQGVTEA